MQTGVMTRIEELKLLVDFQVKQLHNITKGEFESFNQLSNINTVVDEINKYRDEWIKLEDNENTIRN